MACGRPTLYRDEYAEQAYKLCLLSATDADLAKFFGVEERTINNWKDAHEAFFQSITRGKEEADANVAERLYQRAIGYSHRAVKIFMPAGAEEPVYAEYTEHYPPDTQAASLWLRNRQPAKWRDKQDREVYGKDGGPITLTVEQQRAEALRAIDEAFREPVIEHNPAEITWVKGDAE